MLLWLIDMKIVFVKIVAWLICLKLRCNVLQFDCTDFTFRQGEWQMNQLVDRSVEEKTLPRLICYLFGCYHMGNNEEKQTNVHHEEYVHPFQSIDTVDPGSLLSHSKYTSRQAEEMVETNSSRQSPGSGKPGEHCLIAAYIWIPVS